ncbi:MAG: caspase family protein [Saprospiraceae bacterium]|nr:caspase family protein [Saprospiraceae bacterium]
MKLPAFPHLPLCFVLLFCCANTPAKAADPPKKALLVAVGNYPFDTGWKKISSLNDIVLLRKTLEKQGFATTDIHELTDEAATKLGILAAIRQYLIETAAPGGVAFFHFSGHGQQVADDPDHAGRGDELDGYDEAIVPINSPLVFNPGVYEGENLIRDEELGRLLDELRRKLGPTGHLTVVLDACHSGTGTRGSGLARGTTQKMASPDYIAGHLQAAKEKGSLVEGVVDERNLAPMVSFFGAAQHQLNFETKDEEGRGVGSLSFALCKKLSAAPKGTTYRGLFEQVRTEMSILAPTQNPQVEGPLDQELMGGQLLGFPDFLRVGAWNDPGSVTLDAGWLQGIHEGTVVGLFPPETRTIAGLVPIAKGKITYADATSCTVALEADVEQEIAKAAWVFVLEQSFGDLSVSFRNGLPEGHPVLPFLRSKIAKTPVVREADPADLELGLSDDATRGGAVQLLTNGGMVVASFQENLSPEALADRIHRQMVSVAQVRFLKSLEMESSTLPVSFEIIPIKYDPAQNNQYLGDLPIEERLDENGNLRLKVGDGFRIKVTNHGSRPAYFTLLDIQPDNVMNVLMPSQWDPRETPSEFVVEAGSSFEPPAKYYKKIEPPLGAEVFKLIATEQPLDLRTVTSSRGQTRSASQNPFELLLADSFFGDGTTSRGGGALSMSATEVHVETFGFIIEK